VREVSHLQTFPDHNYFCGSRPSNAVPPLVAQQIASVVFRILHPDLVAKILMGSSTENAEDDGFRYSLEKCDS
jgi:hypothetical protein